MVHLEDPRDRNWFVAIYSSFLHIYGISLKTGDLLTLLTRLIFTTYDSWMMILLLKMDQNLWRTRNHWPIAMEKSTLEWYSFGKWHNAINNMIFFCCRGVGPSQVICQGEHESGVYITQQSHDWVETIMFSHDASPWTSPHWSGQIVRRDFDGHGNWLCCYDLSMKYGQTDQWFFVRLMTAGYILVMPNVTNWPPSTDSDWW